MGGMNSESPPPFSQIVVCVQNVSFRRGETTVLNGIDWSVERGQHWAVLGANGSGKTTLMKIVTGYLGSSSGRVYLIEGWISEIVLPDVRKRIGYVSGMLTDHLVRWWERTPAIEVVLSGREAKIGAMPKATGEQRARAMDLLSRFGVAHRAESNFQLLSTGERQATLIARAQMAETDLIILDEPCAGLDLANRERVLDALRESCRVESERPQILITHHVEEIVESFTHVLLIRSGAVVAAGPKDEVLTEANLAATYGIPIHLVRREGRLFALPG